MNLISYADRLHLAVANAFDAAVDDTLEEAVRNAERYSKSGKFADSLQRTDPVESTDRLEARIGSPLRSARAKERGAYIAAEKAKHLVFDAGQGVRKATAVRIPAQPAVTPAGRRFREFMTGRLREARL